MTRLLSYTVAMVLAGLMIWPATAIVTAAAAVTATAGWPLSGHAEILLEYGSPYTREGRRVTHSGVDLSAEPGDTVVAALDGVVSFAGRVPAPGGGTRGVVTIDFGEGLRVTCLPLTGITVSRGQAVSAGDRIGVLGESAGESTSRPHLHVSVRRGDTYLDPMLFLSPPGPGSTQITPDVGLAEPAVSNTQIPATFQSSTLQGSAQAPAVQAATTVKVPGTAGSIFAAGQVAQGAAVAGSKGELAQTALSSSAEIQSLDQVAGSSIQAPESKITPSSYFRELAADEFTQPRLTLADVAKERRSPVPWRLSVLVTGIAALGLWPLWRRRPTNSGEAVVSVRDDELAAAVCR